MKIISTLPDNHADVNAMNFQTMVETVEDLSDPQTQIRGTAGLQVNAFLAHAAVRMATVLGYSPSIMSSLVYIDNTRKTAARTTPTPE